MRGGDLLLRVLLEFCDCEFELIVLAHSSKKNTIDYLAIILALLVVANPVAVRHFNIVKSSFEHVYRSRITAHVSCNVNINTNHSH